MKNLILVIALVVTTISVKAQSGEAQHRLLQFQIDQLAKSYQAMNEKQAFLENELKVQGCQIGIIESRSQFQATQVMPNGQIIKMTQDIVTGNMRTEVIGHKEIKNPVADILKEQIAETDTVHIAEHDKKAKEAALEVEKSKQEMVDTAKKGEEIIKGIKSTEQLVDYQEKGEVTTDSTKVLDISSESGRPENIAGISGFVL